MEYLLKNEKSLEKITPKTPIRPPPPPDKPWVPETERARELVNQGESKRKVAKYLGIPESTLRKRLKRISRHPSCIVTFTPELEEELVKYCTAFNEMSGGLTFTALRKIAYNFAEENHIDNNFDKNIRMADVEFVNDFLTRHPSIQKAIRNPNQTEEISKEQLTYFFDCLKEQLLTHQFNASRIYNVALLDVSLVRTDKTNDNISVILSMSASAHYIPPAFIFHNHGFSLELLNGAPPCSIAIPQNLDIFLEWLRHFQRHVHSSHQDPALLILNDNTFSNSKCVLEFCKYHGLILLNLPSFKLQPLNKTVFGCFKIFYALETENWYKIHHVMTYRHVAAVFRKAYFRSATMENAVEGFRMTGICPFDRDVVTEGGELPALCHTIFQNVVCEYEELGAADGAGKTATEPPGAQLTYPTGAEAPGAQLAYPTGAEPPGGSETPGGPISSAAMQIPNVRNVTCDGLTATLPDNLTNVNVNEAVNFACPPGPEIESQ